MAGRCGRVPERHGARRVRRTQGALPIGISFIGARWHDADMLDLAYAFETATKARRAPKYLPTVGNRDTKAHGGIGP